MVRSELEADTDIGPGALLRVIGRTDLDDGAPVIHDPRQSHRESRLAAVGAGAKDRAVVVAPGSMVLAQRARLKRKVGELHTSKTSQKLGVV